MRSFVEFLPGHARRMVVALVLPAALAGCTSSGAGGTLTAAPGAAPLQAAGPAADYPVVIGEPYRMGETLYTPADTLNYDEVGYIAADAGRGISASHRTLPLPSYAEVTSLDSGRTILVRIERRGPLDGDGLIALSPEAIEQLGAGAGAPVRLRRVNPPEEERALLRAGRSAPLRMDTPEALLAVLKRKLPQNNGRLPSVASGPATLAQIDLPPSTAAGKSPPHLPSKAEPGHLASAASVAVQASASPETPQPPKQRTSEIPQGATADGAYVVQAVALSSQERAERVASAIGGSVSQAGKFYRVRTGPFATRTQAEASLAKVRAAGYSEARIFTNS